MLKKLAAWGLGSLALISPTFVLAQTVSPSDCSSHPTIQCLQAEIVQLTQLFTQLLSARHQPAPASATIDPGSTFIGSVSQPVSAPTITGTARNATNLWVELIDSSYTGPSDWGSLNSAEKQYNGSIPVSAVINGNGAWSAPFFSMQAGTYNVYVYTFDGTSYQLLTSGVTNINTCQQSSCGSSGSLTASQISSIISLLHSIGASSATVANVQAVFNGLPVPNPAAAASVTSTQKSSILNLLQSFGAAQALITSVANALPATDTGITVTAPNGGEQWEEGVINSVTWTPYNYNPDVNPSSQVTAYLETKNTDGTFNTLGKVEESGKASIHWITGELNSATQSGDLVTPGSNYYIRVVNNVTGAWDRSDAPFTVLPKSVDVKVNGQDGPVTLSDAKQPVTISWTILPGNSNCSLYGDQPQAESIPAASGQKTTTLYFQPGISFVTVSINCTSANGSIVNDYVSITATGGFPAASIQVTSPNGGEQIDPSKPMTISLSSTGLSSMAVALYKNDQWKYWINKSVQPTAKNLDSITLQWTPADAFTSGFFDANDNTGAIWKIYATGQKADGSGYVDDKSDGPFTFHIGMPNAALSDDLKINGSDNTATLPDGGTASITWSSIGALAGCDLVRNGNGAGVLLQNASSTGSFLYMVHYQKGESSFNVRLDCYRARPASLNDLVTDIVNIAKPASAGSLVFSVSPSLSSQTLVAGSVNNTVARFVLDASNSSEDIQVSRIRPLYTSSIVGAQPNNCQLYNGATPLNTGANAVNPADPAGGDSYLPFNLDKPLLIPKGTAATLDMKCNVPSSAAPGSFQWGTWSIRANSLLFSVTGATLGDTIQPTGVQNYGTEMDVISTGAKHSPGVSTPKGFFDTVSCNLLRGWSYDPDASSTSIQVSMYKDGPAGQGALLGTYTANVIRPDVNSIIGIAGNHGFQVVTPASIKDGAAHQIYVYGVNTDGSGNNTLLTWSPGSLTCSPGSASPTIAVTSVAGPLGIDNHSVINVAFANLPSSTVDLVKNDSFKTVVLNAMPINAAQGWDALPVPGTVASGSYILRVRDRSTGQVVVESAPFQISAGSSAAGTLTVSTDPSSPSYQIAAGGSTGVTLGAVDIRAGTENVSVTKIGLKIGFQSGAGYSGDIQRVYIYNGSSLVGTASFIGNSNIATSTLASPFQVPAGGQATLTIKADIAARGVGQPALPGDFVQVNVTGASGVGMNSGAVIASNGGPVFTGAGARIFKSFPTVMQIPSTSSLANGSLPQVLLRFSVTASPAGSIGLAYVTPTILANGVQFSSVSTYGYTDPGFSQPIPGSQQGNLGTANPSAGLTGAFSVAMPTNGQPIVIPAGATYYFQIVGSASAFTNDHPMVQTTLNGDQAFVSLGSFNGNVSRFGSSDNFIWSPNDNGASQFSDNDWTNGFGVPGLAAGGITQALTGNGAPTPPVSPASIGFTSPLSTVSVGPSQAVTISWNSQNAPAGSIALLQIGRSQPSGTPGMPPDGISSADVIAPTSGSYVWDPNARYCRPGGVVCYPFVEQGTYYATLHLRASATSASDIASARSVAITVPSTGNPPPIPAALTAVCGANGTVTLSWPAANGASVYYPRLAPPADRVCPAPFSLETSTQGGNCAIGEPGEGSGYASTSITITPEPGISYRAWVHSGDPINMTPARTSFACGSSASPVSSVVLSQTASLGTIQMQVRAIEQALLKLLRH